MTLHLHTAARTDLLADGLADLLVEPPADPFAEELVVVPAKGVERWLAQRLSHRLGAGPRGGDGVCAGVRFLNPRSLVALLLGIEDDDPWDPDRFVWPLLNVVDSCLAEDPVPAWAQTLARHLGHGQSGEQAELRQDRRFSVVRRVAGLFTSYAVQRPQLLTEWQAGQATGGSTDGAGQRLPEDLGWQPELWRRLLDEMGSSTHEVDPPDARHRKALSAVQDGGLLALPDRLSMFGHTRMAVTELELLRALGEAREVDLWLPQPSPIAWDRLADALGEGAVRRRKDTSARLVRHPLLSSLGRDSRELQRSLALLGPMKRESHDQDAPPAPPTAQPTLLTRLQAELRQDQPPAAGQPATRPDDRSVQVHACHGMSRQVEVLREVLVGLLQDDPTLEPRDVLVMCPDIDTYAPFFSAAFALGAAPGEDEDRHPAHRLRVRLADRGLWSTNPLLALAAALVGLAGGRGTASEVLDVAAAEPVRHRFGLTDDDMATVTGWVGESGVRWGLTPELRGPFRLDDFGQNTWQAGLDRLLLGVAMPEEDGSLLGPCLPLDDVGSGSVDLAGRLAELVSRLERSVTRLRAAVGLVGWVTALHEGVLDLGSVPPDKAWQLAQLEREFEGLLDAGRVGGTGPAADNADPGEGPPLRLADVRALLDARLEPRPTRANFRTGALTVATLVPMRSVPHRVVCLVGLDDGAFPRNTVTDGDDVLARDPLTGERDPRSEDRQLLLDAVLSAQETLVVTYTGANQHSGQERPPAVPLGELLDALDRTAPGARGQVLVRHPLQPFDVRNFGDGELTPTGPFSFDNAALAGARATTRERAERPPALAAPLAPVEDQDVSLADVRSTLLHPVRGFFRHRLDAGVTQEHVEVHDALPVDIDALASWEVGDRVLRSVLAGADPVAVLRAEQFRGALPPLQLGERKLEEITRRAQALHTATAEDRGSSARAVDVTLDLGEGRRLIGVVPDVLGDRIVRVHYSNLGPKHRLEGWLDLLALSVAEPDRSWTAHTVGWHRSGPRRSILGPVDHSALDALRSLLDVHDRFLREPVLVPLRTAHAYADALRCRSRFGPEADARREWESKDTSPVPGEQDDPWHVKLLGRRGGFEQLLVPPAPDEQWYDDRSRLGRYARRIWEPLFDAERVASP